MEFAYSERCKTLQTKLLAFMEQHIYPNEKAYKQEIERNGSEKGNPWPATELMERAKPMHRARAS